MTPEEEVVSERIDAFIDNIIEGWTGGVPVDMLADKIIAKLCGAVNSKQFGSFAGLVAQATRTCLDEYMKHGFTREESMTLICSVLTKQNAKS